MNSLFNAADLQPQPLYDEPVKFKHFSGVAKAVLSAREVLDKAQSRTYPPLNLQGVKIYNTQEIIAAGEKAERELGEKWIYIIAKRHNEQRKAKNDK